MMHYMTFFIELSTPFLFSFLCRMLILFFCLCMQQKADSASIHHQPRNCKYCTVSYLAIDMCFYHIYCQTYISSVKQGRLRDRYPPMKFRVSSKDMFAKTAIVAEVNEKFINNSSEKVLASDYWDVIPQESSPEEGPLQSNIRVLSHVQVSFIFPSLVEWIYQSLLSLLFV